MDYIDSGLGGRSQSELSFSAEPGWMNCEPLKTRLYGRRQHVQEDMKDLLK